MSVINLIKRSTSDWEEMHKHLLSTDSVVFIDPQNEGKVGPVSMDVEVGDAYIVPGSNESFCIPQEGVKIKPKQSIIVYTRQRFKLPYNVFGVVTGKGKFIFKGCFLSTGKIDPGFDGCLKIGFFNGGCSSVNLKPNDSFATVYFLNTDTTISVPLKTYQNSLEHAIKRIKWYQIIWIYLRGHWLKIVAWAIVAIPTFLLYSSQFFNIIIGWLSQK